MRKSYLLEDYCKLLAVYKLAHLENIYLLRVGKLAGFREKLWRGDQGFIKKAEVVIFIIKIEYTLQWHRPLTLCNPNGDAVGDNAIAFGNQNTFDMADA
ncbi:hypothetical protein ACFLYB_01870 [Chloroflexota bacterium]